MKIVLILLFFLESACSSTPKNRFECRPLEFVGSWEKAELNHDLAVELLDQLENTEGYDPENNKRVSWYSDEHSNIVACQIHTYATKRFYNSSPRGCSTSQFLFKKNAAGIYNVADVQEIICIG